MSYLDVKYINFLSPRLQQFSWKTSSLAICRCPLCGDSKKKKSRKRFYFYLKDGEYHVKCHNCSHAGMFSTFLKHYDAEMYREYRMEKFQNSFAPKREEVIVVPSVSPKERLENAIKIDLPRICDLPENHPAVIYLTSRKVPSTMYDEIYYSEDFSTFAKTINSTREYFDDPKIVIPFKDKDGRTYGVICRTLNPYSSLRYIILKREGDTQEIQYGIHKIDPNQRVYILEGPIDSMMIPNSIATSGLKVIPKTSLPTSVENCVFVYDNEPRNKDVVSRMSGAVDNGYNICVWPEYITEKDVNDMVLAGRDPKAIIDANIYSGLSAKMKIKEWRKV